ncbi:MAG TPA: DegV family protein [Candidatus Dormibacteraeota bacterium]|jgi:DegV family protein with EDD domain|nr:DegV family protein [Candidatus Dormibacteraeota bacterium]
MPGIRFVADSTTDMPPAYLEQHRVITVPLKVIFGDESLVDGVDITAAQFYQRMRSTARNPTTSQPSPAEFEAAFREATADGSSVVCTTMSAEMSGTYGAAVTAREALPDLDIHVIDTRNVSLGHALLLRAAVECAESGGSVKDVIGSIEEVMRRQRTVFTVETLEYLRRGGRIGGARALLGSVLNIKPVLQLLDGRIEPFDRVRTYARALDRMSDEVISATGEAGRPARVVLGHADKLADCEMLAHRLEPHCQGTPDIIDIGPIVGSHAGPGTIGLSFYLPPR